MPYTQKRRNSLPADLPAEQILTDALEVHPIVARMLVQRGITDPAAAERFLYPSLDHLHDPFLLPDAEIACERIKTALNKKEKIFVHGDYDGDGVTSAALWTRVLKSLGADVEVFVPHRKRDGYDMRQAFIERAKKEGVGLIITTDCGIQRIDEVNAAREMGIDVIITDHHTPPTDGSLPRAIAVVNPHRHDSKYPFKDLAGVGVAFRLCEGLVTHLGHKRDAYRRAYLDLACIGTVTDIMPLLDENRAIVHFGLEQLSVTKKPGLRVLMREAGIKNGLVTSRDIGFGIGPRLNAASRVDETQIALDILMTKDVEEAEELGLKLSALNVRRQEETKRIYEDAMAQVAQQESLDTRCFVVQGDSWTAGIVGLVASRVVERTNRPCIAISIDPNTGHGRGSARSVNAFNVYDAIDRCKDLLVEYGGHAHAAGLSITGERLTEFKLQMNEIAGESITEEDLVPTLDITQEIDINDVCLELIQQLSLFAPFGSGNREPLFMSRDVRIADKFILGKDKQHLKLRVKADTLNGNGFADAIFWNQAALFTPLGEAESLDLCYRMEVNEWNNTRRIQLMLADLKPTD